MKYEKVMFSRSKIEKAGKVIAKSMYESDEFSEYVTVVDNWRAAHAFPLDEIMLIISNSLNDKADVLLVQRLKRLESIIAKLQRDYNSGLYRMQDLGGCRVIVPTVQDVYNIVSTLKKAISEKGHKIEKENDYVCDPRIISGYRSYHIVVRYYSDSNRDYNGMRIEIQVRTKLEHQWATSVEIVDAIMQETLKIGTGSPKYTYFFKLVSALFSINEGCKVVEGVPENKKDIVEEIYRIDKEENIREKLSAYNSAIKFEGAYPEKADYYLLITDTRKKTISTLGFTKEDIEEATKSYQKYEKKKKKSFLDVVLVAAESFAVIRESYPNYFMETKSFLAKINDLCSEFPEKASISFSTNGKGHAFNDLFEAERFERNAPDGMKFFDGVGVPCGDLYAFPAWLVSLEDSYLRYSGIIWDKSFEDEDIHLFEGPAVVVLRTGACFYIEKEQWGCISEESFIVVRCKEGIDDDYLLLLLSWLKSNICTWDLLFNKHNNNIYYKKVRDKFNIPSLNNNDLKKIYGYIENILTLERNFVCYYQKNISETNIDEGDVEREIEDFNNNILSILVRIESIFDRYYHLSDKDKKIMKQEISKKGYYAYELH